MAARVSMPQARLLMTTPAVGPIVALTYACRDRRSGAVQIVEIDRGAFRLDAEEVSVRTRSTITGRISKIGDASVRTALYEAAHLMLTKPVKGCSQLKSWAMRIARRAGMSKAKVALARRLAVIMHRMLADGTPFNPAATTPSLRQLNKESTTVFGRATTPAFPKRSPSPGRWIRSDRNPPSAHLRPRVRRLVGLSSSDPIRWRPRADPVQKQDPGDRTTQKGIDQSRPVTEADGAQRNPGSSIQAAAPFPDFASLLIRATVRAVRKTRARMRRENGFGWALHASI